MADETRSIPRFRRVLLKLSGEALLGEKPYGIDPQAALGCVRDIAGVRAAGVEVCVVVGGGNIFRGLAGAAAGMDRVRADYIGMMATIMNAVALENAFASLGQPASLHSAIPVPHVAAGFDRARALADLAAGRVVIFAGGTGNPFFTTDTTSALRAAEMGCDVILKATQVDGVYSADPRRDPNATRYDRLTYDEALARNLQVMDGSAFAIARDTNIPILVFCGEGEGSIEKALAGLAPSTLVCGGR
jgi:uridylate kinase